MPRRLIGLLVTLALGLLVAPLTAHAQPTGKTASIGYLTPVVGRNPVEEAFEQALQALGWIKERNLQIESRYSGGRQDTIAALAADLVSLRLDVIVAWGPGFGLAVKHATRQTPVVFCSMSTDPVDLGLVANVARPGGHVTGVGMQELGMDAKRLQLLKEAVPSLRRLTLLVSSEQTCTRERRRLLMAAVKAWHLDVDDTDVTTESELALQAHTAEHVRSAEERQRCRRRSDNFLSERTTLFVSYHLTRCARYRRRAPACLRRTR
jgi:ABC-type uncharacterized transport system substrate-binding protein